MSVTGRDTQLVFCEGKPESLDAAFLNSIDVPSNRQIVPAGGKYGLRAFIEGRLSTHVESDTPGYIAFRDRDFDVEPGERPELVRLPRGKEIYVTHRACIESYLIDHELIHEYWAEHSKAPGWRDGPAPKPERLSTWIEESARSIASYQAVRWALARLKPGDRWPALRSTWTKGSGHLPSELALDACLNSAGRCVAAYASDTGKVTPELLRKKASEYNAKFGEQSFWRRRYYLLWFHGKDLMKAFRKHDGVLISMKHYCQWAVEHLRWEEHADLKDLAQKLRAGV